MAKSKTQASYKKLGQALAKLEKADGGPRARRNARRRVLSALVVLRRAVLDENPIERAIGKPIDWSKYSEVAWGSELKNYFPVRKRERGSMIGSWSKTKYVDFYNEVLHKLPHGKRDAVLKLAGQGNSLRVAWAGFRIERADVTAAQADDLLDAGDKRRALARIRVDSRFCDAILAAGEISDIAVRLVVSPPEGA